MTVREPLRLTSLAAIKRACALPGAHLQLVATTIPHLRGTLDAGPRPVVRAQTNAVSIRGSHRNGGQSYDPDVESWIWWPKAANIGLNGDDTFTMKWGTGDATYRVVIV